MLRTSLGPCLAVLIAIAGCGAPYGAGVIVDQEPQGLMEGEPWIAVEAGVRRDAADAEGRLIVSLFAQDVDECSGSQDESTSQVLFTIPAEVGEYPLRLDFMHIETTQLVNFSPRGGENVVASDGVIEVEAVSETEVTIGLFAMAGSSNVNGRFTAAICP